jgi:hypothetical protein
MNDANQRARISIRLLCLSLILAGQSLLSFAQPVPMSPTQLDQLVSRIALYPDPLLANILTASTYWSEIPEAATWVLDMMARDPAWTQQLGTAVLTQDSEVMDAVQRMRQRAMSYGYLAQDDRINVIASGGFIQILPAHPDVLCVPQYDPLVVFAPPRSGIAIAGAIRFGPGITIGAAFGGWGWWGGSGFLWPSHTILIDRRPWRRVWVNRSVYVHPYAHPWVPPIGPRGGTHARR